MAGKVAKAKILMFDLECPYCGDLLPSPEGTQTFSIHESCPSNLTCESCGKTAKTPSVIPRGIIQLENRPLESGQVCGTYERPLMRGK
jgi:ribosomal protein S27E